MENKKSFVPVFISVLIISLLGIVVYNQIHPFTVHVENTEEQNTETGENELTKGKNYWPEGSVEHYNMIDNAAILGEKDVPALIISTIGDYVNQYLQEQGISDMSLHIEDIQEDNYIYTMQINIGNTDSILIYTYDLWEHSSFFEILTQ